MTSWYHETCGSLFGVLATACLWGSSWVGRRPRGRGCWSLPGSPCGWEELSQRQQLWFVTTIS